MPHHDSIRFAAEAAAYSALADLIRSQIDSAPNEACSVSLSGGDWTVTVTIAPARGRQSLDPVERDLLAVLAAAGIPLSTSRLLGELSRRGIDHSEKTVKRRLASLVRSGAIVSRTQPPRGYCLPAEDARSNPAGPK